MAPGWKAFGKGSSGDLVSVVNSKDCTTDGKPSASSILPPSLQQSGLLVILAKMELDPNDVSYNVDEVKNSVEIRTMWSNGIQSVHISHFYFQI